LTPPGSFYNEDNYTKGLCDKGIGTGRFKKKKNEEGSKSFLLEKIRKGVRK